MLYPNFSTLFHLINIINIYLIMYEDTVLIEKVIAILTSCVLILNLTQDVQWMVNKLPHASDSLAFFTQQSFKCNCHATQYAF
jgi:hypothetical protein